MTDSVETRLAKIELTEETLQTQISRLIAHVESEQRVYNGHGRQILLLEKLMDKMDKDLVEHEKLLINGGNGLAIRVDRLEQAEKGSRYRWAMILSIVTVLLSAFNFLKSFILH